MKSEKKSNHRRKLLVLGLGNDILSDDAVGLNIVREVERRLAGQAGIEVRETCEMGLALLDFISGYQDLVLVDAVQTGKAAPGQLHEVALDDLHILPMMSPHFFGISEALALGEQLGMEVPDRVRIFAVEVKNPFTLGTEMTDELVQAMPGLVEQVLGAVREMAAR